MHLLSCRLCWDNENSKTNTKFLHRKIHSTWLLQGLHKCWPAQINPSRMQGRWSDCDRFEVHIKYQPDQSGSVDYKLKYAEIGIKHQPHASLLQTILWKIKVQTHHSCTRTERQYSCRCPVELLSVIPSDSHRFYKDLKHKSQCVQAKNDITCSEYYSLCGLHVWLQWSRTLNAATTDKW